MTGLQGFWHILHKMEGAINNTSVTVTFGAPVAGDLAPADFVFNNGLTVSNVVKSISGETFTLTTSAQVAGTDYALTFKGTATGKSFVGMAAQETNQFEMVSAESRSNTEVTVVLSDAPLRNLTVADFGINGLTINSVTTNNNVVTLKTTAQTSGATYTVVAITGTGSATFTGKAAVDTTGVIDSIEVLNLRQIKVNFNKHILWTGYADTKTHYYLEMVDEITGDIATNRLDTIDATNSWQAVPGTQDVTDPDSTVDYVIIESDNGALITDALVNGGLGLQYNKTITLEARNLEQVVGVNYINTSQGSFIVSDTKAPKVEAITTNAEVNKLVKSEGLGAYFGYTLAADKAYLEVEFSEPVTDTTTNNDGPSTQAAADDVTDQRLITVNTDPANPDFKIYIDGIEVPHEAASVDTKAFILDPGGDDNGTAVAFDVEDGRAVEFDSFVENQKTMLLDVTNLSRGTHTFKIVGAEDLKGNVMNPNPYQGTFVVSDEVLTPPNVTNNKAKVVGIEQIADNAIEIYFDQDGVEINDPAGAAPVIIEKAEWDNVAGQWMDIEADPADVGATLDLADEIIGSGNMDITYDTYENEEGDTLSKWIVLFNAVNGKSAGAATGEALNYDSQKIIARDVVVQNYVDTDNTSLDPYYVGDVKRENFAFSKDTTAPVTENDLVDYDVAAGELTVSFSDAPFGDVYPVEVALSTDASKKIKVSMTDKNGVTYDEYFTVNGGGVSVTGDTLTFDLTDAGVDDNDSSLVDANDELIRESVYTISFPQGAVEDTEEEISGDLDADLIMVDPAAANEMIQTEVSIAIPAAPAGPGVAEGLVPQTTKGLIASGIDIINGADAVNVAGNVGTPGTVAYMSDANNQNQIVIVFDGEVLESSALNKKNYMFNNAVLPQASQVAFYNDNVNTLVGVDGVGASDDAFVLITLPEGSVQKDGLYTIRVSGITNKTGKLMLPVEDSVALVDNTRPTANEVKAIGSKQIEVIFDEKVALEGSTAQQIRNFAVTVDNVALAVNDVALKAGEPNKLILTMSQDFDDNGSLDVDITVVIKADQDGNIFVVDTASPVNKANVVTVQN